MTVELKKIAPPDIEQESFRIIREELGDDTIDERTFPLLARVIHATGDFSFRDNLRLHPQAIVTGIQAIRDGRDILTDVTMVAAGISKKRLARWGGKVHCRIADNEVATAAKSAGTTRSEMAIRMAYNESIGIIAIGNAPTALVETMRLLTDIKPARPPLIIGVPVGFVNAAESKALLAQDEHCFITSLGRKGGSPVAAALVNALLLLADNN